jgi:hypothetical protein
MGSISKGLEGRDEGARERVEHLRAEITRLSEELAVAEEQLSRLTIARETVLEVLAGPELPGTLSSRLSSGVAAKPTWRAFSGRNAFRPESPRATPRRP